MSLLTAPLDPQTVLDNRSRVRTPNFSYKLTDNGRYGLSVGYDDVLAVNESEMSIVIPFADGNRRDGVGDLLEVGGIRTERHRTNAIASDVPPVLTRDDVPDQRGRDVEHLREFRFGVLACVVKATNAKYFEIVQLYASVFLSSGIGSVNDLIGLVVDVRVPSKIFEAIVSRISVGKVAPLHPFGTRPNEGKQNEAVKLKLFLLSVDGIDQTDSDSIVTARAKINHSPFDGVEHSTPPSSSFDECPRKGFDAAPIANTIQSLVAGDIPPVFVGAVFVDLNSLIEGFSRRIVVHGSNSESVRIMRTESDVSRIASVHFTQTLSVMQGGVL